MVKQLVVAPEIDLAVRVADLNTAAMRNDFSAVDKIIGALGDKNPEVRMAAREAAVQAGNQDLIPALMVAVSQTDDAREKAELLNAIDFLQLPALGEALAQQ